MTGIPDTRFERFVVATLLLQTLVLVGLCVYFVYSVDRFNRVGAQRSVEHQALIRVFCSEVELEHSIWLPDCPAVQ